MSGATPPGAPRSPSRTRHRMGPQRPRPRRAWSLDRSITTSETLARHHYRLDGKLAKIDEEWSLSDSSAYAGRGKDVSMAPSAPSALVAAALHDMHEEAERLLREGQAVAGHRRRTAAGGMTTMTWTGTAMRSGKVATRTRWSSGTSYSFF